MKLSIILPVYNPAAGWAAIVLSKTEEIKKKYPLLSIETIVVNDGSDNQNFIAGKTLLQSTPIKLLEYTTNKGKGEALRIGVESASGDLIIYTDIDFPYTIDSMSCLIDMLQGGSADVVIGIKNSAYYQHVPAIRRFISIIFRAFIRLLLRIPTDDTQCGLKGFNQKGKAVFMQTTIKRYLFDLEFVFLASRNKIVLKMQEVELREDVQFTKMNFGIIRHEMWNFLKILAASFFH